MTEKKTTVSQSTLKSYSSKIYWATHDESLPFMQGEAIKRVITEYEIPATDVGYDGSLIAVKTKNKIMFWRDLGTHLEFKGILDVTQKAKKANSKSKVNMNTPLFSIDNVEEVMQQIRDGLNFPYVQISKDTLGGDAHVTIMIRISTQPREDWSYNIFQNSPHANISIERNRTVEQFSGNKLKMRKFKAKNIEQIIDKINNIKR